MDVICESITELATRTHFKDLPDEVVAATDQHVADTIGCALGALAEPAMDAVSVAAHRNAGDGQGSGRVIGETGLRAGLDTAAFVNTALIRYLDFNDWSPDGHPSDCLGGLLTLAAWPGVTGQRLVSGVVVAYEVFIALQEAIRPDQLGWDQGLALGVATVAGLGNMLALPQEQVANALSIVATSGIPTRATRAGTRSMWKGLATAQAVRNAVFACVLAGEGISGPQQPFAGKHGIFDQVRGPFELSLGSPGGQYRLLRSALKSWPACYHVQAPAWAAHYLHDKVTADDIDAVAVSTHRDAWTSTGRGEHVWNPQTRETADHSIPYVVARVLTEGTLTSAAFSERAYTDPSLRPLMAKISVTEDPEATRAFPGHVVTTISVTMTDKTTLTKQVVDPAGHPNNPVSEDEIRAKFHDLASRVLREADRVDAMYSAWRHISQAASVNAAMDELAVSRPSAGGAW